MISKVLIVSRDTSLKQDGGSLVSKRNERILQQLGFETIRFVIPIPSMLTRLKNVIFRESYGQTISLRKEFLKILREKYDYIFFDGSIYGGFIKIASDLGHRTICFYHNVETEYYTQKASKTKSILDKLMIPFISYNEKRSTKFATLIITLNKRDSDGLKKLYGRSCDAILPTSFPEKNFKKIFDSYSLKIEKVEPPYLLFVGTNFFANIEGLKRFISNIAPYVDINIYVIGNINESFKNKSNIPQNIKFLGKVDSLEEYYVNASAVIAPIFSGSGLKTKTAEALSFAKTVIGFPEAFQGIEYHKYPGSCLSVESDRGFIDAINGLDKNHKYNENSENLFKDKLSDKSQINALRKLLNR